MAEAEVSGVGLAEKLIAATDWSKYHQIQGSSAHGVGRALQSLLKSDRASVEAARDDLENKIAPQGNLYSAAEPAISVLAACLIETRPRWVRIVVLDLMFLILSGAPVGEQTEPGGGTLVERCAASVRESLWAVAQVALDDATCFDAALDVLDIVDPVGRASALIRSSRNW